MYLGYPLQDTGCTSSEHPDIVSAVCGEFESQGWTCSGGEVYIGVIQASAFALGSFDFESTCGLDDTSLMIAYVFFGTLALVILTNLFCTSNLSIVLSLPCVFCASALAVILL